MTQLVVAVTGDLVKTAFKSVGNEGVKVREEAALQSISDAVRATLERAWVKIEDVVGTCLLRGWEDAKELVSEVSTFVAQEAEKLGQQAVEFRQLLLERLRSVISETFDLVLASMRSEVRLGEVSYRLESIDLEHKLVFSSSVKASLTALCKFVGSGELVVKGSYGIRE